MKSHFFKRFDCWITKQLQKPKMMIIIIFLLILIFSLHLLHITLPRYLTFCILFLCSIFLTAYAIQRLPTAVTSIIFVLLITGYTCISVYFLVAPPTSLSDIGFWRNLCDEQREFAAILLSVFSIAITLVTLFITISGEPKKHNEYKVRVKNGDTDMGEFLITIDRNLKQDKDA